MSTIAFTPDGVAGLLLCALQEALADWNRPMKIQERFMLFHEHLGDPKHHAKLMEKAIKDGSEFV